jgi:hypothetical protein
MDQLKQSLLVDLADYTATIDLALEGKDLDLTIDFGIWVTWPCAPVSPNPYTSTIPLNLSNGSTSSKTHHLQLAHELTSAAQSREKRGHCFHRHCNAI